MGKKDIKNELRQSCVNYIRSLSDKEFTEFFYEAMEGRNTSDFEKWKGHFVLSDTENVENKNWEIDHIALHDSDRYPEGWDDEAPICQSGECSNCGSVIRSWAKHAICPVCNNKVFCT